MIGQRLELQLQQKKKEKHCAECNDRIDKLPCHRCGCKEFYDKKKNRSKKNGKI